MERYVTKLLTLKLTRSAKSIRAGCLNDMPTVAFRLHNLVVGRLVQESGE